MTEVNYHDIFLRAVSAYHSAPVGSLGVGRDRAAAVIREAIQPILDEAALLRADCLKLAGDEVVAGCEGCGAWLLSTDEFVSDWDGGATGCWATMTDDPATTAKMPCYAYRVGRPDARCLATQSPAAELEQAVMDAEIDATIQRIMDMPDEVILANTTPGEIEATGTLIKNAIRIAELERKLAIAEEVMRNAAATFMFYADEHDAKAISTDSPTETASRLAKGQRNRDEANKLLSALAQIRNGGGDV